MHKLSDGREADLGFVGEVKSVNDSLLRQSLEEGVIPVIAPLGIDAGKQMYNINADHVAAAVAASLKADHLVFMTDVPGVLSNPDDRRSVVPLITRSQLTQLMHSGAITGGMLPKLSSCMAALEGGAKQVHIVDGQLEHPLIDALCHPSGAGTHLCDDEVVASSGTGCA